MLNSYLFKYPILCLQLCLATSIMYIFTVNIVAAQQGNQIDNRQLVIGDLSGRTDIREAVVFTKFGYVRLYGSDNGRPFEIINRSQAQIELKFYPSQDLKFNNPHKLLFKYYESERALISALILEEVDFAILENEISAREVSSSNNHFLPLPLYMIPNTAKLICYNHRNQILKPSSVRVALAYAINYNRIIKKIILGGKANIARGPFDDDSPLYNSGMESYKYNPRMAIALLKEGGWRDTNHDGILDKAGVPFSITLFFQKGLSLDEAISRQIRIDLLKIGVDVKPKAVSKSEINDHLGSFNFDAVLMDFTFENNVQSLEEFFSVNGAKNYMGYKSNSFEYYLKHYDLIDDPDQKLAAIKKMQIVINNDQPVNFLYFKWLTHYIVNVNKFDHFREIENRENIGRIKPFEQWIIKNVVEK